MVRLSLIAALLTVLWTASLAAGPGAGGKSIRVVVHEGSPRAAAVVVQEFPVLTLRGPNAAMRAAEVARRLVEVVREAGWPFAVTLRRRRGATDLLVSGRRIVTADAAQARHHRTTPARLAGVWAQRLRQALSRNTLTLTPQRVLLRPG